VRKTKDKVEEQGSLGVEQGVGGLARKETAGLGGKGLTQKGNNGTMSMGGKTREKLKVGV